MSKLIFARDVRKGDVIRLGIGEYPQKVERVGWEDLVKCSSLFLEHNGRFFWENCNEDSWLELLHRPASKTRPRQEVRKDILLLYRTTEGVAQFGEEALLSHLGHLSALIDEYVLSTSPEQVGSQSSEGAKPTQDLTQGGG